MLGLRPCQYAQSSLPFLFLKRETNSCICLFHVSPDELEALGHTENSVCIGLNHKGSSLETDLLKNVLTLTLLLCVSVYGVCVGMWESEGNSAVTSLLCQACMASLR